MVKRSVIVLRCGWQTPLAGTTPMRFSENTYAMMFSPVVKVGGGALDEGSGMSGVWQQAAQGTLEITAAISPWFDIPMAQEQGDALNWGAVVRAAAQAAVDNRYDMRPFDTVVVCLDRGPSPSKGGRFNFKAGDHVLRGGCVVDPAGTFDHWAHEYGHALGFVHSKGSTDLSAPMTGPVDDYWDPYCLMSANTFAGLNTPGNPGPGPERTIGPLPAAGTLAGQLDGYTDAPRAHWVDRRRTTSVTLTALSRALPGEAVVAIIAPDGAAPGPKAPAGSWTLEYRDSWGYDAGLSRSNGLIGAADVTAGRAVVVHEIPAGGQAIYRGRLRVAEDGQERTLELPAGRVTISRREPRTSTHDVAVRISPVGDQQGRFVELLVTEVAASALAVSSGEKFLDPGAMRARHVPLRHPAMGSFVSVAGDAARHGRPADDLAPGRHRAHRRWPAHDAGHRDQPRSHAGKQRARRGDGRLRLRGRTVDGALPLSGQLRAAVLGRLHRSPTGDCGRGVDRFGEQRRRGLRQERRLGRHI